MTLILMRSPKGGVGTTFMTARLAIALAARGRDVSAVDCTGQDSLKLFFEMAPSQPLEVLDSDVTPNATSGVQLFGISPSLPAERAAELLLERSEDGRISIVDLGIGRPGWRERLLPHAAIEICPIVPSPVALAALTRVDSGHSVMSLDRTVFVLNQLDDRRRLSNDIHKLVRTLLGDQLLGIVRRDEAVNEALAAMKPLSVFAPASAALKDVDRLADALLARIGLSVPEAEAMA